MAESVIVIPFPSLLGTGYPDHLGLVLASRLQGHPPPDALNPSGAARDALYRAKDAAQGAGNLLGEGTVPA